jgi:hypothetical protein
MEFPPIEGLFKYNFLIFPVGNAYAVDHVLSGLLSPIILAWHRCTIALGLLCFLSMQLCILGTDGRLAAKGAVLPFHTIPADDRYERCCVRQS